MEAIEGSGKSVFIAKDGIDPEKITGVLKVFDRDDSLLLECNATALKFSHLVDAQRCVQIMSNFPSATGCNVHRLMKDENVIHVIVSPTLRSWRKNWLKNPNVDKYWLNKGGFSWLGMSEEFCETFRAILQFLKEIHDKNYYYGNLMDGVFLGNFGSKPVFTNFKVCPEAKTEAEGIAEDFHSLAKLVEEVISMNPLARKLSSVAPKELDNFRALIQSMPEYMNDMDNFRWKIYNHPLFWGVGTRIGFYDLIWSLRSYASNCCDLFSMDNLPIKKWWTKIPPRSPWDKTYKYADQSEKYACDNGFDFVLLVKNLRFHPKGGMDDRGIIESSQEIWPDACIKLYLNLSDRLNCELKRKNSGQKMKVCDFINQNRNRNPFLN